MFGKMEVESYKSFKDRASLEIRGLTLLAGANSSGKSSIMQPLLLLKQTLQSSSDPGPLKLDGPNIIFSRSDQLFWRAPGKSSNEFSVYIELFAPSNRNTATFSVELSFSRRKESRGRPRILLSSTRWSLPGFQHLIKEKMTQDELNVIYNSSNFPSISIDSGREPTVELSVVRQRCFHAIEMKVDRFATRLPYELGLFEKSLREIIHVPGLRGNPSRTYPIRAVGYDFPGQFHEYVASLIANWQRNDNNLYAQLNAALSDMGLTWKIRSFQRDDINVELQVGRAKRSIRGGAKDLVSIADVGFGLSQSLPVIVALLAAKRKQLVYIEQPEIHLHPDAQISLAKIIVDAANRGVQVVVETHSHILLLAIQNEISLQRIDPKLVILHWFSREYDGSSSISSTTFEDDGSYSNASVPVDFDDISIKLMREYLFAQG